MLLRGGGLENGDMGKGQYEWLWKVWRVDVGKSGQLGVGMSIVNGVRGQAFSTRQHPSSGA